MSPTPNFAAVANKQRVAAVRKALNDINAGKPVSARRLTTAQGLCIELLEECNARRPHTPTCCGGRVPPIGQ